MCSHNACTVHLSEDLQLLPELHGQTILLYSMDIQHILWLSNCCVKKFMVISVDSERTGVRQWWITSLFDTGRIFYLSKFLPSFVVWLWGFNFLRSTNLSFELCYSSSIIIFNLTKLWCMFMLTRHCLCWYKYICMKI